MSKIYDFGNMSAEFKHTDMGKEKLRKYIQQMKKAVVLVGLPGNSPQAVDSEFKPLPITVAGIGIINELGSVKANIPPRPFMRQTRERFLGNTRAYMRTQAQLILNLRSSPERALKLIGAYFEGRIKWTIRNGTFAPNAPATIRMKKSSKPLIDTGLMRASVTHVLKMRGK